MHQPTSKCLPRLRLSIQSSTSVLDKVHRPARHLKGHTEQLMLGLEDEI